MKRQIPPLRLTRSPLVLVLAQVRILPVLKMDEFVPSLQESLRHQGLPKFSESVSQGIVFGPDIKTRTERRWLFSSRDATDTAVVAESFISLMTSRYELFEAFIERLRLVLETVGVAAQPGGAERLGLRYVDLIRPAAGESLGEYLDGGLLGLRSERLGVQRQTFRFESVSSTPVGQLRLRLWQTSDGTVLPPDLPPGDVRLSLEAPAGETVTLLDIDSLTTKEQDFQPASLCDEMWRLHEYADRAFQAAVTPTALERWGAVEWPPEA